MEHGDPKSKANDKGLKNVFRWLWVDEDFGYTDKDGNPQQSLCTTFSQLKPSVVKKSDTTFKTLCQVVLLVSPRQNKKSSKILPS